MKKTLLLEHLNLRRSGYLQFKKTRVPRKEIKKGFDHLIEEVTYLIEDDFITKEQCYKAIDKYKGTLKKTKGILKENINDIYNVEDSRQ